MASGTFFTFWDATQYLLDVLGTGVSDGTSTRQAKRAILNAYRDIPGQHSWTYFNRDARININAQQTSSSITFDFTGGAYERLLTIASGSWPTWAASGAVSIASINYQVDTRESATRLTLKETSNPGEDVAAGTSYILYQDRYTLPVDFREGSTLRNETTTYGMQLVTPSEIQQMRDSSEFTGTPRKYTIVGDRDLKNRLALLLYPPSSTAYKMDLTYYAAPAPLRTPQYSTGTATVSGTTVKGSGTAWTTDMAGAVFRTGTATKEPDGREGDDPFVEEVLIKQVDSATSLVIDSALSNEYSSAVKYRISDLVDISDGALLTYFMQYAEMELARLMRSQDYQQRFIAIQSKLKMAMAQDNRFTETPGNQDVLVTSLFGIRATSDYA